MTVARRSTATKAMATGGVAATVVSTLAGALACATRPLVITQPAGIAVERSDTRHPPRPAVTWDTSFWHATTTLNFPVAWAVANTREERQLIDALQLMRNGETAAADSTLQPLLHSEDTLVRHAAQVSYTALLSETSAWGRLAAFAPSAPFAVRDAAGVETWASAFRNVQSRIAFSDTVSELPLLRGATGIPVVTVRVNGVVKRFWIDTGSSITILSAPVAAVCGIAPVNGDTLETLTSLGRVPARPAVVASLRLGNVAMTDIPAMIVDSAALVLRGAGRRGGRPDAGVASVADGSTAEIEAVDGILGFDVIRRLDLTIDDARGRVVIRQPVVRTDDQASQRNLFWFGVPIVTLLSGQGVPIYLALDTGAEETYGTRTLATKTKSRSLAAERRIVNAFGGSAAEKGVVISRVRLFLGSTPLLFQRVFLYDAQYPTIFELDGTLGADVGRGGVVRIDMTNGRFEFESNGSH